MLDSEYHFATPSQTIKLYSVHARQHAHAHTHDRFARTEIGATPSIEIDISHAPVQ